MPMELITWFQQGGCRCRENVHQNAIIVALVDAVDSKNVMSLLGGSEQLVGLKKLKI
jgi:hypothetical protein